MISYESVRCTDNKPKEWLNDCDVVSVFRLPPRADSNSETHFDLQGRNNTRQSFSWI